VLEVFFKEPTTVHFIREIGKNIELSQTSVRNHIKKLLKMGLIKEKPSKPFDGFVANRENEDFIFYKRVYNLYSIKDLSKFISTKYYPKVMVLYGSYSVGEDVESSDIDIFVLSKAKQEIKYTEFENTLMRKIHVIIVDDMKKIDIGVQKRIHDGTVLYGGF
jgi:predicted nucleotidyltransferase